VPHDKPSVRTFEAIHAWSGDIDKLCSGIEPVGGRIKDCRQGKVNEL